MRETEGNYAGKKQRHGNEFISVWNSAEMRETEGKSCTLSFFIYVSLIGNGTSPKSPPTKNSSNLRNIWGGIIFSWPRIFN